MFAPEGWIPLRDVYEYFCWYFSINESIGDIQFTGDEAYQLTWRFMDEAVAIAVCCQDGTPLPASRALVEPVNEYDNENLHVNLHLGTVGSGMLAFRAPIPSEFLSREEYLLNLYGPFRYLPIILKKSNFSDYLEKLANSADDSALKNIDSSHSKNKSPRAVSEEILHLWRSGKAQTFDSIKERVAPHQSVRQFRFAWGLAKMEEPGISKPGRRKQKS